MKYTKEDSDNKITIRAMDDFKRDYFYITSNVLLNLIADNKYGTKHMNFPFEPVQEAGFEEGFTIDHFNLRFRRVDLTLYSRAVGDQPDCKTTTEKYSCVYYLKSEIPKDDGILLNGGTTITEIDANDVESWLPKIPTIFEFPDTMISGKVYSEGAAIGNIYTSPRYGTLTYDKYGVGRYTYDRTNGKVYFNTKPDLQKDTEIKRQNIRQQNTRQGGRYGSFKEASRSAKNTGGEYSR